MSLFWAWPPCFSPWEGHLPSLSSRRGLGLPGLSHPQEGSPACSAQCSFGWAPSGPCADPKHTVQVRQVRLFQDEEIYSDLYLTVCEWPSDASKVIVFGFK